MGAEIYSKWEELSQSLIVALVECKPDEWPDDFDAAELSRKVPDSLKALASRAATLQGAGIIALADYDDEGALTKCPVPDADEIFGLLVQFDKAQKKAGMIKGILGATEDISSEDIQREKDGIERILSIVTGKSGIFQKTDGTEWPDGIVEVHREEMDRSQNQPTGTVFDTWCILGPSELGLLVAPPETGKSAGLTDIACGYVENAEDGVVIYFSEEMSKRAVMSRCAARLCRNELWTPEELEKVMKQYSTALVIESHATGTSTTTFLRDRIRRLAKGRKIVAVVIDYLSLLTALAEGKYERLENITIGLVGSIAKYFECPVWSAVQPQRNPSRDMRKGRGFSENLHDLPVIRMMDISECWAIPQLADYIVSINQSEGERSMNPREIRAFRAKVRWPSADAPNVDTVSCNVDYATSQFL